jgi:hypothetical protein
VATLARRGRPLLEGGNKSYPGLERELARKEKALAEAAALLILKKKLQSALGAEDDDTDEENEK